MYHKSASQFKGHRFNKHTNSTNFLVHSKQGWKVEILPWRLPMGSVRFIEEGISPTTINLDGKEVVAPESPGLISRNK